MVLPIGDMWWMQCQAAVQGVFGLPNKEGALFCCCWHVLLVHVHRNYCLVCQRRPWRSRLRATVALTGPKLKACLASGTYRGPEHDVESYGDLRQVACSQICRFPDCSCHWASPSQGLPLSWGCLCDLVGRARRSTFAALSLLGVSELVM